MMTERLPPVRAGLLVVISALAAMAAMTAPPARGQAPPTFPTGVRRPTTQEREWLAAHSRPAPPLSRARLEALPSAVKNLTHLPAVGSQHFSSCSAWAAVYYMKTWQEAREHGWTRPNPDANPERVMSPDFVYNLLNNGRDAGVSMEGALQVIGAHGAASWAEFPSNVSFLDWPVEAQWRAAIPRRARAVGYIDTTTDAGLAALKERLAGGDLAIFAMRLYENFFLYPRSSEGVSNGVFYANAVDPYTPPDGNSNHALCVIGYDDARAYLDDTGTTRTGAVLVVNSWGSYWGLNDADAGTAGFIWLAYDFFKSQTWGYALTMEDRVGYAPREFAVYEVHHDRRSDLSITILGGDKHAPDWSLQRCYPHTSDERAVQGRFVIDLTDVASSGSLTRWMAVSDALLTQPGRTGEVTYFAVEREGAAPWPSRDAPMETVDGFGSSPGVIWLHIGLMENRGAVFEGVRLSEGHHAWADMDNDGDPDMAFCGSDGSANVAGVHRNNGDGTFTAVDAGLLPLRDGNVAWGDVNGDGYPDLALCGTDESAYQAKVYLNDGGGVFVDSGAALPAGVCWVDWADYDGDGDADLAMLEQGPSWDQDGALRIWRNTGGVLADSGVAVAGPQSGHMAWADHNNDGRLDVAVCGDFWTGFPQGDVTRVMVNDGVGGFTQWDAVGGVEESGVLAWGDVDNDGLLDLAVEVHVGFGYETRVYYNNGYGYFQHYSSFPAAYAGSLALGDLDNDGRLDVALCGDLVEGSVIDAAKFIEVYLNQGGRQFRKISLGAIGVSRGDLRLCDVDGDGDLDMSVCGSGVTPYPMPAYFEFFENVAADANGLGRPNQAPQAPTSLWVERPVPGGPTRLRWEAGTDAETPEAGLYYNVRVGANPGWNDVASGAIGSPFLGSRLRPKLGLSELGVVLDPAPPGAFFWSVQTIDAGLRASPWSGPRLECVGGTAPGDVDASGALDVGDLLHCLRMADGAEPADPARADRNGDGRVDRIDVDLVKAVLLASEGVDPNLIAWGRIGSDGGVVASEGFSLTVPPGAFGAAADLRLRKSLGDRPFGADTASPVYIIDGVPEDRRLPLLVRLPSEGLAATEDGGQVYGVLEDTAFIRSLGSDKRTYQLFQARDAGNGLFEFDLPAPDTAAGGAESLGGRDAEEVAGYTHYWRVSLLGGYGEYSGGHFLIYHPTSASNADIENLASGLEAAYAKLSSDYGLSYARRSSWPVHVTVKDLGPDAYGYFVCSKLGDNYGYMEFNSLKIPDATETRVTAGHEFFHLAQSLYDPRNRLSKAVLPARHYWLDEAMSVWCESLFAGDPDYVSTVYAANTLAPLEGMHQEGKTVGPHGYGMAALIKYLISRQGNGFVADVYNRVWGGAHPVTAVIDSSPDSVLLIWLPKFFGEYYKGSLYGFGAGYIGQAAPRARQFAIAANEDIQTMKLFKDEVPDLGALTYLVNPTYTSIPADAGLFVKIKATDADVAVVKYKGDEREFLTAGQQFLGGVVRLEAPNLAQLQADGWRLLVGTINDRREAPYTGSLPFEISMGVATDDTFTYQPANVTFPQVFDCQFPTFQFSGSVSGRGLLDRFDGVSGLGTHFAFARVAAVPPQTYHVDASYSVVATQQEFPAWGDHTYRMTFQGFQGYRVDLIVNEDWKNIITHQYASPAFDFEVLPEYESLFVQIIPAYTVRVEEFDSEGAPAGDWLFEDIMTGTHTLLLWP